MQNSKKIGKKFLNVINTHMDNETYCSDPFLPTRPIIENSKKNSNKIRKSNKYPYGFISSQNRLEKVEKERK